MPANEEIDAISLGLRGDASSLLTALTKGGNAVVKFTKTVTGEAEKATSTLDAMFAGSARAVLMLQTPLGELSPELATLSNVVKRLADTFRKADTEIAGAGKTTRKTKEEIENSAAVVNRLAREYKAGALSVAEYTAQLRVMAETSKAGSEKQLAAMARLKAFREGAAEAARRESERDTTQRLKDIARTERDEKKATAERIRGIKEIEAAQAKADRERAQATKKQNRGEATIARGLGTAANTMTMGVTAPVLFAGWDALKASSSLNESQDKTKVVFKESASAILAWAKTTADSMAISERAALDQAATVGITFNEMGKGPAVSAQMSESLVKLAGDWASLRDVKPEVAMEKFRSALGGNARPLREWGVDVSIAALKTEAYATGIAKPTVNLAKLQSAQFKVGEATMKLSVAQEKYGAGSYEAMKAQDALNRAQETLRKTQAGSMAPLTQLQKAEAAYSLIMKHSNAAMGNYARTRDQEANSRRRLQAETEDLAAAYGKLLIPALVAAEHRIEAVVKWFKALSPEQKQAIVNLLMIAAAIGPVLKLLEFLVNGWIAVQKAQAFLKDLPQLLMNVAAKITAMGAAETAAAGEMTVLSGATAVAEAALTSMGIAGVTGVTAIVAAVGVLALALAGIAADIWLIKRDWDVVSETMALNAKTDADNAEADGSKAGKNAKIQREYATAKDYHKFLKDGKGDRQKYTEGMDEAQLAEFNEAVPASTAPMIGGRYASTNNPIGREMETAARRAAELDTQAMQSQAGIDADAQAKKRAKVAALPKAPLKPTPTKIPHVPTPSPHHGGGGASYRADYPEPQFKDLEAIEQLLDDDKIMTLPVNAKNYGAQKQKLADRFSEQDADQLKPGAGLTEFAAYDQDRKRLEYQKNLAESAETNTHKTMVDLLAKEKTDEDKARAAYAAVTTEIHRQNAVKAAGGKLTQADGKRFAELSSAYREANTVVKADSAAIQENQRVHREAVGDKISAQKSLNELTARWDEKTATDKVKSLKDTLKESLITRAVFDSALQAEIDKAGAGTAKAKPFEEALAESGVAKAQAAKELHLKSLQMNGQDFQARREAVDEEAAGYTANGAKQEDVDRFKADATKKIGQDEWEQGFHEAQAAFQDDLSDGKKSLSDYKAFLETSMEQAGQQFTRGSAKVAALNREIERVDWSIAEKSAADFKRATDEGDQSIQAYVTQLKALQAQLPQTSIGYQRLQEQIDATNKKIRDDAHQTADKIGTEYGGMFVKLLRRTATFGQMLRETLNKAMDDALAGMMKRAISSMVFKILDKNNKKKQTAEDKQAQAAGVQITAANGQLTAAGLQKTASENNLKAAQLNKEAAAAGAASAGGTASAAGTITKATGAGGGLGKTFWADQALSNVGKMTDGKYSLGDAASSGMGIASSFASAGKFGAGAASAMPWVGVGLAAATLAMGFLNKPQKPDYVSHEGAKQFSSVGQGDHTGLIDSGYSGVDGIRMLQSSRAAKQSLAAASNGAQHSHSYGAGAFQIQINAQPHHDTNQIVQTLMDKIEEKQRLANAGEGSY